MHKNRHPHIFTPRARAEPLVIEDDYHCQVKLVAGKSVVQSGALRTVDPKAVRELGPSLIFSLHADQVPLDV